MSIRLRPMHGAVCGIQAHLHDDLCQPLAAATLPAQAPPRYRRGISGAEFQQLSGHWAVVAAPWLACQMLEVHQHSLPCLRYRCLLRPKVSFIPRHAATDPIDNAGSLEKAIRCCKGILAEMWAEVL